MKRPIFSKAERRALGRALRKGVGATLMLAGAALGVALLSYDPNDSGVYVDTWERESNWLGEPGAYVADGLMRGFGVAGYAAALLFLMWGARIYWKRWISSPLKRLAIAPIALFFAAIFASAHAVTAPAGGGLGGLLGDFGFGVLAEGLPFESAKLRLVLATLIALALAAPTMLFALGGDWAGVRRLHREARRRTVEAFGLARQGAPLTAMREKAPRLLQGARATLGSLRRAAVEPDLPNMRAPIQREPEFSDDPLRVEPTIAQADAAMSAGAERAVAPVGETMTEREPAAQPATPTPDPTEKPTWDRAKIFPWVSRGGERSARKGPTEPPLMAAPTAPRDTDPAPVDPAIDDRTEEVPLPRFLEPSLSDDPTPVAAPVEPEPRLDTTSAAKPVQKPATPTVIPRHTRDLSDDEMANALMSLNAYAEQRRRSAAATVYAIGGDADHATDATMSIRYDQPQIEDGAQLLAQPGAAARDLYADGAPGAYDHADASEAFPDWSEPTEPTLVSGEPVDPSRWPDFHDDALPNVDRNDVRDEGALDAEFVAIEANSRRRPQRPVAHRDEILARARAELTGAARRERRSAPSEPITAPPLGYPPIPTSPAFDPSAPQPVDPPARRRSDQAPQQVEPRTPCIGAPEPAPIPEPIPLTEPPQPAPARVEPEPRADDPIPEPTHRAVTARPDPTRIDDWRMDDVDADDLNDDDHDDHDEAPIAAARPTPRAAPSNERADRPAARRYEPPSIDLLAAPDPDDALTMTERMLAEQADALQAVLADYGVKGDIIDVHPGPVVTLFELEPAPGLKAARVIGLADDIARSMSAVSCRISTIPGRNVIGIELPNAKRETVMLRELLAHTRFTRAEGALALALGKDIAGEPVVANLARMPHLLIAGTTGSGKSVSVNAMILSLLYRLSPDQVRMIMIDPKMLELSVYNDIPHLLAPVVTDPKKAVTALKWAVREMERRYERMAELGVRGIDSYNQRIAEIGGETDDGVRYEPMPRIVVVVDEMADLMLVAGKEIEHCIQRLAQMARAAGIHLIMATQRPSVDVITGTIKANFPIRISFQVTSKIDSRTILGEQGAEQLLGRGDMLYSAGGARLTRIHGPFVSDEEVEEVAADLRSFGPPDYRTTFDDPTEAEGGDKDEETATAGSDADLYDRAVALVATERKASTSFIQRRLSIGYNRAARIIEMMESEGVVSAANHVGKREILIAETA